MRNKKNNFTNCTVTINEDQKSVEILKNQLEQQNRIKEKDQQLQDNFINLIEKISKDAIQAFKEVEIIKSKSKTKRK